MYYYAIGCDELKNKKLKTKVYLSAETDHLSFTFGRQKHRKVCVSIVPFVTIQHWVVVS